MTYLLWITACLVFMSFGFVAGAIHQRAHTKACLNQHRKGVPQPTPQTKHKKIDRASLHTQTAECIKLTQLILRDGWSRGTEVKMYQLIEKLTNMRDHLETEKV